MEATVMRTRVALLVLAVAGIIGGSIVQTFRESAWASRNSSGVYSLPSGNPVVTGTTITSSWANTTLNDLATETTNSLDRSGRGAMTAPLQCYSGTVSAPGLTFSAETNTGLYRAGSHDIRMSVNGVDTFKWTTGSVYALYGLTATNTGNNDAIFGTGNGTGTGIEGVGGATSGDGLKGTGGAPNGLGVEGRGTGSGMGGHFYGGATSGANGAQGEGTGTGSGFVGYGGGSDGYGLVGFGGNTNGQGVAGRGAGTGAGGSFGNGTAATGGTRQDALVLENGDISFAGVANVTSTTGVTNRLTPSNIVKAWAHISSGATPTVNDGFNIGTPSCAANNITVNLVNPMASAYYAVHCDGAGATGLSCTQSSLGTSSFVVSCVAINSGVVSNLCAAGKDVACMVVGKQ